MHLRTKCLCVWTTWTTSHTCTSQTPRACPSLCRWRMFCITVPRAPAAIRSSGTALTFSQLLLFQIKPSLIVGYVLITDSRDLWKDILLYNHWHTAEESIVWTCLQVVLTKSTKCHLWVSCCWTALAARDRITVEWGNHPVKRFATLPV